MSRRTLATATLLVLATLLAPGATPGAAAQEAVIDSVFAAYNRTDSPGCAVGVLRNGTLVLAKGYGMANLEHGIALSPRSVFRIGSVSKQFTAAAMVLLEQDGALSLDDPVRRHIPELPDYGPEFTIRRLLTHTSGVRDYLVLMDLAGLRADDYYTDEQVVAMLARQPETNFEPGSEFLYSNSGYFLLSQIVKRVTGRTLGEYARARIFEPLAMRHTHFHDDHTRIVPDRATGYAPREPRAGDHGGAGADGWTSPGWRISVTTLPMVGDGGVFTTVEDLALWDRNLDHPEVGGPAFVEAMLRRGVLTGGDTLTYALGLDHGTHRGLPIVAHGGAFVGYRAASLRYPGQGVSVYTLCNRADANPSRLARQVGAALLNDRMTPPPAPGPAGAAAGDETVDTLRATPAELRPFAGAYHSPVLNTTYRVRLDADTLRLDVGNWLDGAMAAVGDDVFRRGPLQLRFTRAPDGGVTGLEVDAGRVRGIRFERVDDGR